MFEIKQAIAHCQDRIGDWCYRDLPCDEGPLCVLHAAYARLPEGVQDNLGKLNQIELDRVPDARGKTKEQLQQMIADELSFFAATKHHVWALEFGVKDVGEDNEIYAHVRGSDTKCGSHKPKDSLLHAKSAMKDASKLGFVCVFCGLPWASKLRWSHSRYEFPDFAVPQGPRGPVCHLCRTLFKSSKTSNIMLDLLSFRDNIQAASVDRAARFDFRFATESVKREFRQMMQDAQMDPAFVQRKLRSTLMAREVGYVHGDAFPDQPCGSRKIYGTDTRDEPALVRRVREWNRTNVLLVDLWNVLSVHDCDSADCPGDFLYLVEREAPISMTRFRALVAGLEEPYENRYENVSQLCSQDVYWFCYRPRWKQLVRESRTSEGRFDDYQALLLKECTSLLRLLDRKGSLCMVARGCDVDAALLTTARFCSENEVPFQIMSSDRFRDYTTALGGTLNCDTYWLAARSVYSMNEWKPIWNSTGGWKSASSLGSGGWKSAPTQTVFLDYSSIMHCAKGAGLDVGQTLSEVASVFRAKHAHVFVYGHTRSPAELSELERQGVIELNERGELLLISQHFKYHDFPFMPTRLTRPSMTCWDYFIPTLAHFESLDHECFVVSNDDFHSRHKVRKKQRTDTAPRVKVSSGRKPSHFQDGRQKFLRQLAISVGLQMVLFAPQLRPGLRKLQHPQRNLPQSYPSLQVWISPREGTADGRCYDLIRSKSPL